MKIWELTNDNEKYDYLVWKHKEDVKKIVQSYYFNGESLITNWTPIEVEADDDICIGDSLYLSTGIQVLNKHAIKCLYNFLLKSTEILPIKYYKGDYYIVNVLKVLADCIDYNKSEYKRFKSSGRIMRFIKFEFITENVKRHDIFKIDDLKRSHIFVSDNFRNAVIQNDLTGFKFIEVWDSEKQ